MLPQDKLAAVATPSAFAEFTPSDGPLTDTEMGGVALNNASQGLKVKSWTLNYDAISGDMQLSAPDVATTVLFNRPSITQIALAFDQSMQPFVAFVQAGVAKFWWFKPTAGTFVFEETLIAGSITPRCGLDDKRQGESGVSDVILAYMRDNNLYYRQQRDSYTIERLARAGIGGTLRNIGFNSTYQMQFEIRNPTGA